MAILAGQKIRALDFAGYKSRVDYTNITGVAASTSDFTAVSPLFGMSFMAPSSGSVKVEYGGRLRGLAGAERALCAVWVRTGDVLGAGADVATPGADEAFEVAVFSSTQFQGMGTMYRVISGLTPGAMYNATWGLQRGLSGGLVDVYARVMNVSPWHGD